VTAGDRLTAHTSVTERSSVITAKSSYLLLANTLGREDIQYLLHDFKY